MIQEAVERLGFVGIRVHRHDARITREICEAARAYRLPVLCDLMGEGSTVILHLGSFVGDWGPNWH
jgi:hypothetical protein